MLKKFLYILWISIFAVLLFFSVKNGSFFSFIGSMENRTFDIRQNLSANSGVRHHNKDIVIVAIDDGSYEYILDKYGEWPLRRDMYAKMDLVNPAAIIDANHSNSGKQFKEQIRIVKEVMHNRQLSQDIHNMVKGVMIESYIEPGNQKIGCDHIYGKSITDPCLGWEESERLLYTIAEMC